LAPIGAKFHNALNGFDVSRCMQRAARDDARRGAQVASRSTGLPIWVEHATHIKWGMRGLGTRTIALFFGRGPSLSPY